MAVEPTDGAFFFPERDDKIVLELVPECFPEEVTKERPGRQHFDNGVIGAEAQIACNLGCCEAKVDFGGFCVSSFVGSTEEYETFPAHWLGYAFNAGRKELSLHRGLDVGIMAVVMRVDKGLLNQQATKAVANQD